MLLLAGNVRPLTSAPCGRRDLLTTELGPEASGSKPGKEGCDQMPEKSGTAAGATAGPAVCPKAGVAAATANMISNPKFRCLCMTVSLSWLVGAKARNGARTSGGGGRSPGHLSGLALAASTTALQIATRTLPSCAAAAWAAW